MIFFLLENQITTPKPFHAKILNYWDFLRRRTPPFYLPCILVPKLRARRSHTCREIMHIHYFRTIFHYFGFEIMLSRHHFQHVKISYVFISKASLFYVQTLHVGFRVLNYWYSFRQYGCNSSFSSSFGFRPRGWWFFWLARFSRLTGPGELADFLILTYNGQVKRFKYT